ncbi:MAG: TonB-dependent receptor [Candidatus Solibacter usitatus]|nr:TonB-dependent receptor [Candidatus Solibacter usitatus]
MSRWVWVGAALGFALFAQVSGRISGTVTDSSGALVPNASVELMLAGGKKALLRTTTTASGGFALTALRPESYDIAVSAPGFVKYTLRAVTVDPGKETSLPAITLQLSSVNEVVEVSASLQTVQTANAEIAATVTNEQVRLLPLLDRDPMSLIFTQAGVSYNGASDAVINGLRSSYSSVTLEGINIQDNFLRGNGLTYQPNLLLLDQVGEFTISTSNGNSTLSGGSSQVSIALPSGGNQYHGALYWYNRNNALAAGHWFDNKDGIPKAFLNQNQVGGSLGGPLKKDKLFFYTNYEAFRNRQRSTNDRTILTADARGGIFTYRDTRGNIQKVNILRAMGVSIDPALQQLINQIPGPEKINNFRSGDSSASLLRNTAGYSFAAQDNRTRDNVTTKLDYNLSTRHILSGSYIWNRDLVDRNDAANDYSVTPKVTNDNHTHFLALSWRWSPGATFVNEMRGGFNLARGVFPTTEKFGDFLIDGMVFDSPVNYFRAQGRDTNTYNFSNGASYNRGRHTLQFGFQMQKVRTAPFNDAGITPTYTLGVGTGNDGLEGRQLPGIGSADFARANELLATLAGYVDSYIQTLNVTSRTSGFVPNATDLRHFTFDNYAGYLHDSWKVRPRWSLTLGLRYEYFTPVDERDGLVLLPQVRDGGYVRTMLSNATLDFAGSAAGRPFYASDRNNFAPNIGLAWDLFGNGKTALRAGYSVHFVNDESIAGLRNSGVTNGGLSADAADSDLTGRISSNRPKIVLPKFKVPRTMADNRDEDVFSAHALPDPNLRTPYVQQWTVGIQHEIKGNILEVRYVGNHGTKQYRAFDFNQVVIRENGFLADFLKARGNGFLARNSSGVFDPRFNPNLPGSQRLPVFDSIEARGLLTNSTIRTLIEQGEPGTLAYIYHINDFVTPFSFFRNPNTLGANVMTNYSNSTYHALQTEVRRRTRAGLNFQANYTFSKVLSDASGDGQSRFEPFLDFASARTERFRAPFDLTQVFNANAQYFIPMGKGHRFDWRPVSKLLGGWSASSILSWQSGAPFSILSGRGTVNRPGRNGGNTVNTSLTKADLEKILVFRKTGDGPYIVAQSAIGPDGRGVAADGRPAFQGQAFFNPDPGAIGALQRRLFSGPPVFSMDFGVQKSTRIRERHDVQIRMESTNILNHPTFFVGNLNINSTQFGRVDSTLTGRRVIQFGLYYRF